MWTVRMWVPRRQGRSDLHLSNPNIKASSIVHISVSEATNLGPPLFAGQNFSSFMGNAAITLQNVVVRDGGVDFRVFVDWGSPLNLVTDITIMDGPPNIVIGT